MGEVSYATARKIRIIEERIGTDWKNLNEGRSVDRVYSDLMGDVRKNLFCKIDPSVKDQLDEMSQHYDIDMAELIETLITDEYAEFSKRAVGYFSTLANQFAETT